MIDLIPLTAAEAEERKHFGKMMLCVEQALRLGSWRWVAWQLSPRTGHWAHRVPRRVNKWRNAHLRAERRHMAARRAVLREERRGVLPWRRRWASAGYP
jgi:hypothetical protein